MTPTTTTPFWTAALAFFLLAPVASAQVVPRIDLQGDLLPEGALVRFGSVRLRHQAPTWGVGFSPDGKFLASASTDSSVCVWDAGDGKLLHRLLVPNVWHYSVAFAPDGKLLAAGDRGRIRLWEFATGKEIRQFNTPTEGDAAGPVFFLAFTPDGRGLISGSEKNGIIVWDSTTGKALHRLGPHQQAPFALALSSNGKTLAVGLRAIQLVDVSSGQEITRFGENKLLKCLAFSPDGKVLASGDEGRAVRLWDTTTGQELRALAGPTSGIEGVVFSPNGKTLASAGRDFTVRLWDVATGKLLHTLAGLAGARYGLGDAIRGIAFSPDGRVLAAVGGNRRVRLWNTTTGQELGQGSGHQRSVRFLSLSSDGKTVLSGGDHPDRDVYLWATATGKGLSRLEDGTDWATAGVLSPDGAQVATGNRAGEVRLWDWRAGTSPKVLRLSGFGTIFRLAYAPDCKKLAIARGERVALWDLAAGQENGLGGHDHPIGPLAYTPDGNWLISGANTQVAVWEVDTRKRLRLFEGNRRRVCTLAVSADGKTLAVGGWTETVRLWDLTSGKELPPLEHQEGESVQALAFSPDGRTLAAGVGRTYWTGAEVRLWELASHQVRQRLPGHLGIIYGVAFAPDGQRLVSGASDTTALVWDVTGEANRAAEKMTRARLQALWAHLADTDATKAHTALWTLARSPRESVPFFQERLPPLAPLVVPKLVANLGENSFVVREQAVRELQTLGQEVVPALRQTLGGQLTLEVQQRVEQVLANLERLKPIEPLRRLRMVEVLEYAGTAAARQVLQTLAQGPATDRVVQQARVALERLARRAVVR